MAAIPARATAQATPASPCPNTVAECTQGQALAAATEWLAYHQAYYPPSRNPTLHHYPAEPGSEFARYTIVWESGDWQQGTYHVSWYRATTFPGLPDNPCSNWSTAENCTRASARAIADAAYEHKVLESPSGAWLVNLDQFIPEISTGYFCVRRTQPGTHAGCYFSVFFKEYEPEHSPESNLGKDCDVVAPLECGNPINYGVGNKFQAESDLNSPTLPFARYYNSDRGARYESLGPQWTHSYSRYVTTYTTNGYAFASVRRPMGSSITFRSVPGGWAAADGETGQLQETFDASGTRSGWLFEAKGSSQLEHFDAVGRLVKIEMEHGGWLDLHYTNVNINPPENLLLSAVTNHLGRSLTFTYDSRRLLQSVSDDSGSSVTFSYGSGRRLELAEYADGSARDYIYNEPANTSGANLPWMLTGIVDESGTRFATYRYDSQGRAFSTSHAGGANLHVVNYATPGQATVTGPTGAVTTTTIQLVNGRAVATGSTTQCSGCTPLEQTYVRDSSGRAVSLTNAAGDVTAFEYDAAGNITKRTEASGGTEGTIRTTETDWHATYGHPIERRIFDATGTLVQKLAWSYNPRGQLTTQSSFDPATQATRSVAYGYCETADVDAPNSVCPILGLPKYVDGPRTDVGDVTTIRYRSADSLAGCGLGPDQPCHRKGDVFRVVDPDGSATEYQQYDLSGRITQVMDKNGVKTRFTYHPRGWLVSRSILGENTADPDAAAVTTIDYSSTGLVTKITEPDGTFVEFLFDAAHRLVAITDSLGNTLNYTLDSAGNRVEEKTLDANSVLRHTLTRVFNQLGQLESLADSGSNPTDFAYDLAGNLGSVIDRLGRTSENHHDSLGRLRVSIVNASGAGSQRAETQFDYDALDRLVAVTDPKGLVTQYTYDAFGNLLGLSSPDTGSATYGYDGAGNRVRQIDARGIESVYAYDAIGRLTTIRSTPSQPGGGNLLAEFIYDTTPYLCGAAQGFNAGRLSAFTDPSGSTTYCHDRRGNVVRKVQQNGGGQDRSLTYGYTLADRISSINYPSGLLVTYSRNAAGQVTGMTARASEGVAPVTLVSAAEYLPFGPLKRLVFANGRVLDKNYDLDYGISSVADSAADGLAIGYSLDDVGNVTGLSERQNGGAVAASTVQYDGLDRLTQLANGATTVQGFTYDATGNRTHKVSGATANYVYAADSHRLTKVGTVNRTYDATGNSTAIGSRNYVYDDRGRMSQSRNGATVLRNYLYNALGQRVAKVHPTTPGSTVFFVYDEAGRLMGEYKPDGTMIKEYLWLDDTLVAVRGGYAGHKFQYVLTDHLGTPRAVVLPSSNAIIWRWDITGSAFGDHTAQNNPDGDTTNYVFNLRYPGQYLDSETGLHYNYFRDYDPATGRYVQSDPIGLSGGISTFSYVGGSPLQFDDPLGLCGACPLFVRPTPVVGPRPMVRPHPLSQAIRQGLRNPPSGQVNRGTPQQRIEQILEQAGLPRRGPLIPETRQPAPLPPPPAARDGIWQNLDSLLDLMKGFFVLPPLLPVNTENSCPIYQEHPSAPPPLPPCDPYDPESCIA